MENKVTLHSESSRELFEFAREHFLALLNKEFGIGIFQRKRAYPKALLYTIFLAMIASKDLLNEKKL